MPLVITHQPWIKLLEADIAQGNTVERLDIMPYILEINDGALTVLPIDHAILVTGSAHA
jgi:hypothetical protein